jgi:uncharacterized protein YbjT (DUF2867 family)
MAGRTVVVAGATGLVGREILAGLLADASVAAVHSLGRRKPVVEHRKLTSHVVYFTHLLPAGGLDDHGKLRALIYHAIAE